MSNIDAPDYQRAVSAAQQVLASVSGADATVTVTVPPNVKALWVLTEPTPDPTLAAVGTTTDINYPVYFTPQLPQPADTGVSAVIFVAGDVDSEVRITWGTAPGVEWFVLADLGGRFTVDAVLAGTVNQVGSGEPASAVLVAGSDGTDLYALLTDDTGQLKITGSLTDDAEGTPGDTAPSKAVQVAGSDGTDLRVLATSDTGVLETADQNLKNTVAAASAAAPTNVVQVGGTNGTDLIPLNLSGEALKVADTILDGVVGDPGAATPGHAVEIGLTDSGALLRTMLGNSQGIPYAIPSAPDTASGDHPPNELSLAGVELTTSGSVLAAAGTGKRYRLFTAHMATILTGQAGSMYDAVSTTSFIGVDEGGMATITFGPSGLPLSENAGVDYSAAVGSGTNLCVLTYTTEEV